jgi:hypothetical protein
MWGGGFWGTAREEQWHRRKEKEAQREEVIRSQEEAQRRSLQAYHTEQVQSKENVLELTRRMLSVARNESELLRHGEQEINDNKRGNEDVIGDSVDVSDRNDPDNCTSYCQEASSKR